MAKKELWPMVTKITWVIESILETAKEFVMNRKKETKEAEQKKTTFWFVFFFLTF